ncbi:MAG: S41 family peptidase [Gemmatimonadaceae bacterium]
MNRIRRALLLVLVLPFLANGQPTRQLTAAQAREDVDTLRHALEEAHGALYRFTPKAELDRPFDGYRSRITGAMSLLEFHALTREMVAEIGDGHARLDPDDATMAAMAAASLPLRVAVEGDRLIVTSNDSPDDTSIQPGMEVVRINGHTGKAILAALYPRMPRDGFIETGRRARAGRGFPGLYWLFVDRAATFVVETRDAGGALRTVMLAGISDAARARAVNVANAPYLTRMSELEPATGNISLRTVTSDVALLRIRAFDGASFVAQLDSVVSVAVDAHARAMILDLRGNGGGVDMDGAHLVGEFTDRPFRYFDHIHLTTIKPSFATWRPGSFVDVREGSVADPKGGYNVLPVQHPGVVEQPPASKPFLGKLVVMLDGGTFSTAADVTAVLRSMRRATFVGEESGGAYEGNTSGLNARVILPNSRIKFSVQMFGYVNAVTPAASGRGTLPDHTVTRTTADVLRGLDPVLAKAIEVARMP